MRSWNQRIKLRSVFWSFFQSYLWQIWKWQPWKMNWYFFRKWLLFIKMFYFLFRLDDHGAFKTHILAKKIVSLNCLFLQRNGNGTTVPLLWNEERRMRSFYQIWNEERNAFLFSARNEEQSAFLKLEERLKLCRELINFKYVKTIFLVLLSNSTLDDFILHVD